MLSLKMDLTCQRPCAQVPRAICQRPHRYGASRRPGPRSYVHGNRRHGGYCFRFTRARARRSSPSLAARIPLVGGIRPSCPLLPGAAQVHGRRPLCASSEGTGPLLNSSAERGSSSSSSRVFCSITQPRGTLAPACRLAAPRR